MTTLEVITLAKEKLGRNITEQEAQDYIEGKVEIPDEALDIVSGGSSCMSPWCLSCGSTNIVTVGRGVRVCADCGGRM